MNGRRLTGHVCRFTQLGAAELNLWREWRAADRNLQSPFLTPEYAQAVGRAHPGAHIAVLSRNGQIVAFLPFQHANRAARALAHAEPIGGAMTDGVGVIARPDFRAEPDEMLQATGLHSFYFTHLVAEQERCGLVSQQVDQGLAIDLRAIPDYWEHLRRRRNAVVEEIRRRRRRLSEQLGPVTFQFTAAGREGMLARLIALKVEQYRRTGMADPLRARWTRDLLGHLAELQSPDCSGVLSSLEVSGRLVAAHFGLRSGSMLHYWFPVYDPQFSRFSPGRLLLAAIIDAAPEHGISRIERGIGSAPAKRDFANVELAYGRGMLVRQSQRAAATRLALSLRWRWQRLIQSQGSRIQPLRGRKPSQTETQADPAESIPLGP